MPQQILMRRYVAHNMKLNLSFCQLGVQYSSNMIIKHKNLYACPIRPKMWLLPVSTILFEYATFVPFLTNHVMNKLRSHDKERINKNILLCFSFGHVLDCPPSLPFSFVSNPELRPDYEQACKCTRVWIGLL